MLESYDLPAYPDVPLCQAWPSFTSFHPGCVFHGILVTQRSRPGVRGGDPVESFLRSRHHLPVGTGTRARRGEADIWIGREISHRLRHRACRNRRGWRRRPVAAVRWCGPAGVSAARRRPPRGGAPYASPDPPLARSSRAAGTRRRRGGVNVWWRRQRK